MPETPKFIDFCLEIDDASEADNDIANVVPESCKYIYWSNIPPIALPNGSVFYYARVPYEEFNRIKDISFIKDNIVGTSWLDIWDRPYRFRDEVFQVSVSRSIPFNETENITSQIRIPISSLLLDEVVIDNKAYPPGVFVGDEVPIFEFNHRATHKEPINSASRVEIRTKIKIVSDLVSGSNELTASQKSDILGYLRSCESILGMYNADRAALKFLLEKAGTYAKRIGAKLIEHEIMDLVQSLFDLWPF